MICKEFYKTLDLKKPVPLERKHRVKFNRFVFENYFKPRMKQCEENGVLVDLNESDLKVIGDFVDKKSKAKALEWKSCDSQNRTKRETTGACIEYGLLKYFGKEDQFDNTVVDKSYKRNHPDLLPLGIICDVKGSSLNNVPLVFKSSRTYTCNFGSYVGRKYRCSNIIGITDKKRVWLLGVASPRVLEDYVDDNLIMLSTNTTKTGFYGVEHLTDLPKEWSDFKELCSKNSLIL